MLIVNSVQCRYSEFLNYKCHFVEFSYADYCYDEIG